MPQPPVLIKPILPQVVNEGAAFGPFNLNDYIQSPNEESGKVVFLAELADGNALVSGLICTSSGIVSGIPAVGTQGNYEVMIIAENDSGIPLVSPFKLTIKTRIALDDSNIIANLKSQVWEALSKNLPIPEFDELYDRPLTAVEVYYLLQRFATLTIWDAYNLDAPIEKQLLQLKDASPHYHIYDRGSCLVAAPKDLFSHKRTLEDALQSARAMTREVYKRGWTIEFAGFDKMVRASWIELQHLADQHGKQLDVLHYTPSAEDLKIYSTEAKVMTSLGKTR